MKKITLSMMVLAVLMAVMGCQQPTSPTVTPDTTVTPLSISLSTSYGKSVTLWNISIAGTGDGGVIGYNSDDIYRIASNGNTLQGNELTTWYYNGSMISVSFDQNVSDFFKVTIGGHSYINSNMLDKVYTNASNGYTIKMYQENPDPFSNWNSRIGITTDGGTTTTDLTNSSVSIAYDGNNKFTYNNNDYSN